MNTGIIATRYATALLKLVEETGSGESLGGPGAGHRAGSRRSA